MGKKLVAPIGERIRDFRTKLNLSQDQLAALVRVSTDTISRWERNKLAVRRRNFRNLCSALGCSFDDLCGERSISETHRDESGFADLGLLAKRANRIRLAANLPELSSALLLEIMATMLSVSRGHNNQHFAYYNTLGTSYSISLHAELLAYLLNR